MGFNRNKLTKTCQITTDAIQYAAALAMVIGNTPFRHLGRSVENRQPLQPEVRQATPLHAMDFTSYC